MGHERLCKASSMADSMVFEPESTYMGADDNHAGTSGSGYGCLSAEGTVAQNRAGTGGHLPSDQLWVRYSARYR